MRAEQLRKRGAKLVGDLQQQRAGQAVLEIGRDEAADVTEVVPDRALAQIALQRGERARREQVVEIDRAGGSVPVAGDERVAVGALAHGAARAFRCAVDVDGGVVVLAEDLALGWRERCGLRRHAGGDLLVRARHELEALAVAPPAREIAELVRVMHQLAAVCRRQRRGRDAGAILAAPQFIGAGKMVERATPFALRQPEKAECAMAAVVLRLDGAGAAVALDGVMRAAARFERGRAIVMRGGVARLGGDRRVEMTDRGRVLALRGGEDAEVVGDGAVAGRHAQRRAIRSLRLVEPARLVQGDRVRDQLLELACCQCVHGPVTGCCEMSTASRRRLAAARALPTLLHRNARENGLPQGYMGDIWLAHRQRTSAPTRRPPSQVGEQTSPCTTASFSRLTLVRLR